MAEMKMKEVLVSMTVVSEMAAMIRAKSDVDLVQMAMKADGSDATVRAIDPPPDPGKAKRSERPKAPTAAGKTLGRGARDGSATEAVLDFLKCQECEVGIGDIIKGTGLERKKVAAALKTLQSRGDVENNGGGKRDMKYSVKAGAA